MNHIEKGRLLTGLFPERLTDMLRAVRQGYENLKRNKKTLRPSWNNSFHSFDYWYALAANAAEAAAQYESGSIKGTQLLSEKLFTGCTAYYSIDCIAKHAQTLPETPENTAYKTGVRLLFESDAHIDINPKI